MKKTFFFKRKSVFFSKCFTGHNECICQTPAVKIFAKDKRYRWSYRKVFPKRNKFSSTRIWTHRRLFWRTRQTKLHKTAEKTSFEVRKQWKKRYFCFKKKTIFLKMLLGTCKMKFWRTCRFFWPESRKNFFQNSWKKHHFFYKSSIFLKMCLRTCRVPIWQHCGKSFDKLSKMYSKTSENNWKEQNFFTDKFSISFHGHVENILTTPLIFIRVWKTLYGSLEVQKKSFFIKLGLRTRRTPLWRPCWKFSDR